MKEVFESKPDPNKPQLIEIPRKKFDGEVISASRVRALIENVEFEKIKCIVPTTTYEYIRDMDK